MIQLPLQIALTKKISLQYRDAGYGDTFIVGAVARELKKKYGDIFITVNGTREEVLEGNPWVDATGNKRAGYDLNYHRALKKKNLNFSENLLSVLCEPLGIKNPEHRVDFFSTQQEKTFASEIVGDVNLPVITMQTSAGPYASGRKDWIEPHWETLVGLLKDHCRMIQVGGSNDYKIRDGMVTSLIGKLSFRQAVAVVEKASVHIGVVSSLMHASAAVNTKAVILFGGFEKYGCHLYDHIVAVESDIDCAPCCVPLASISPCPMNRLCMRRILPEYVADIGLKVIRECNPD